MNNIDFLFYPGMHVVDLGSAPGGWSKYVKDKVGKNGRIIACDVLPMNKIVGVDFLEGNICDPNIFKTLITRVNDKVHIVLSDMSPNITGIADVDVSRSMFLGEVALSICKYILISGGTFLVKIFQGDGFDKYFGNVRFLFNTVKIRKPNASHIHSREVYIVAKGYKV